MEQTGESSTIPAGFNNPHFNFRLFLLSQLLADHSKTLEDFGLPPFILQWDQSGGNPLLIEQLGYN